MRSLSTQQQQRPATLMWIIWRQRNDKVSKAKDCRDVGVLSRANSFFQDWLRAKNLFVSNEKAPNENFMESWRAPYGGKLKYNVDASSHKRYKCIGFGLCVCDDQGRVLSVSIGWMNLWLEVM